MLDKEHAETQEQIIKAAMRHFAEYGYHGASIAKIAEEAGVSKSLIFWYFESKNALFQCLVDHFIQSCKHKLSTAGPTGNARDKIEALIDMYWNFIGENVWFIRIFIHWFLQLDSPPKKNTQIPSEWKDQDGSDSGKQDGSDSGKQERNKALAVREIHNEFRQIFSEYLLEGKQQGIFREDIDIPNTAIFLVSTLEGILLQLLIDEINAQALAPIFFQSLKTNLMEGLLKRTGKV